MDSSVSENETINEVETLKQQLATYKEINFGLSHKIQELKVELNVFRQENSQLKKELIDEKSKNVECRRYFNMINENCFNFINTHVANMEQINEKDRTLMNGNRTPQIDEQAHSSTQFQRHHQPQRLTSIRDHLRNFYAEDDSPGNNQLNTIVEESFLKFTSTPKPVEQNRRDFQEQLLSPIDHVDPNELVVETPRASGGAAAVRRIPVVEENTNKEDSNKENDVEANDSKEDESIDENSQHHTTVKNVRVHLTALSHSRLENQCGNQMEATGWETEESVEKSTDNSRQTRSKSKQLKRKTSEHRSSRKAKPALCSLMEPSLRTKMRRSSDKKKYM